MSSLKQVLKNIYTYFDILQTASGFGIICWNESDIQNAFQWAKYCEEVYMQSVGKRYQAELARYVSEITELPWGVDSKPIGLQSLNHASMHLQKVLRSNEYTTEFINNYIEFMYESLEPPKDSTEITRACSVAKESCGGRLAVCLVQARILLKQVIVYQQLPPARQLKCKVMIEKKLDSLLTCAERRLILLTSLGTVAEVVMLNVSGTNLSVITEAQQFVLNWMLQQPTVELVKIYQVERLQLLRDVSRKYFPFYKGYMQNLICCSNALVPEYDKNAKLHFRYDGEALESAKEYDRLQERFVDLAQGEDDVATATKQALQSLIKTDFTGVWSTLLKKCS